MSSQSFSNSGEWITQAEAARLLNISSVRVHQLVKSGQLPFEQDASGRKWVRRAAVCERLYLNPLRSQPIPTSSTSPISCATMLEAVKAFHQRNQFIVGTGTRNDLLLRLVLLLGELGELAETVTKSAKGSIHGFGEADWTAMQNEWGDVLYLLIGWAVELGWNADTITEIFQRTHQKNLSRAPRHTALARTAPEPPTTE